MLIWSYKDGDDDDDVSMKQQNNTRCRVNAARYLGGRDKNVSKQVWMTDTTDTSTSKTLAEVKHWNARTEQLRKVMQQN